MGSSSAPTLTLWGTMGVSLCLSFLLSNGVVPASPWGGEGEFMNTPAPFETLTGKKVQQRSVVSAYPPRNAGHPSPPGMSSQCPQGPWCCQGKRYLSLTLRVPAGPRLRQSRPGGAWCFLDLPKLINFRATPAHDGRPAVDVSGTELSGVGKVMYPGCMFYKQQADWLRCSRPS